MRHRVALRWLIALGSSVAIHAGPVESSASAGDDKANDRRGKITLYADFLKEDPESSRGLHVVDPATGVWTEVAKLPSGNGVVGMQYIRVSPDGTQVAFNEYKEAKDRSRVAPASVWLRGLRPGDEAHKISDIGGQPIWSPDGKGLLLVEAIGEFGSRKPGRYATTRINVDGSDPVRLPVPESDQVWDWSADGRWLAAVSPGPNGGLDLDIVVMHPDGTGKRRLTESGRNLWPRLSPDGGRLAYFSQSKGVMSVWVVDLDGSHRRRIYAEAGDSFIERVAWSPDGKSLVAVMMTWTRDGKGGRILGGETLGSPRLCILDLDGAGIRFIPHPAARVLGDPDWR